MLRPWITASLTCALLCCPIVSSAGPWTKNAGEAYVKLGEGWFFADEFVDASGQVQSGAAYLGQTTSVYGEVGIADGLHLQFFVPHTIGTNDFEGVGRFRSARVGDVVAGLQYSSPWLNLPHAVRAEAKVPFYDASEPGGLEGANFPLVGDGQIDYTVWLAIGDSIPNTPIYALLEVGHRFRTETFIGEGLDRSFGDSFVAFGQVGVTTWKGILLMANLQVVAPYEEDPFTKGYVTLGPGLYAPVGGGFALEAGYDGTLWARNSANGQAVTVGVSYSQ
ncbi:MAG: hypothetical protein ACE366_31835 [Bradymonadia bacterium]